MCWRKLADESGVPTEDGVQSTRHSPSTSWPGWSAPSRESVVRALTDLRRRGLVETGRRRLVVRDLTGLEALTH